MRVLLFLLPVALVAQVSPTRAPAKPKPAPQARTAPSSAVMTDDQKIIYALGLSSDRSIGAFNLSPNELAIVQKAMSDAAAGKPAIELNTW